MKVKRILSLLVICTLVVVMSGSKLEKASKAATTVHNLKQVDAAYGSVGGSEEKSHYVTISWSGTAEQYAVYQVLADGSEVKLCVVGAVGMDSLQLFKVIFDKLKAGLTITFRIYECDEKGEKLSEEDPGVTLSNVRTLPKKPAAPKLSYWYRSSSKADFTFGTDSYADGYELRAETPKGKKLKVKTITGSSVSGSAAASVTLKPAYHGRVVHVKVRSYVKVNGKKKYTGWSKPYVYASAKKLKLSGYKDAIKISGLNVTGAKKKEIYVSRKEKSGYKLAKTLGAKTSSCKVTEYGKKYIESDKTYYVRVYYYYKLNGKLKKSAVCDQAKVYVKPTYFYLKVS